MEKTLHICCGYRLSSQSFFSVVSDLACMFRMNSRHWCRSLHDASLAIRFGSAPFVNQKEVGRETEASAEVGSQTAFKDHMS